MEEKDNQGSQNNQTLDFNEGDLSKTLKQKGGDVISETENLEELKKQLENFKHELSSRDKKITELTQKQKEVLEENLSLESLQKQLIQERRERTRTEFALRNNLSEKDLSFVMGETIEELSKSWGDLKELIQDHSKALIENNRQRLSNVASQAKEREITTEDLIKKVFESR